MKTVLTLGVLFFSGWVFPSEITKSKKDELLGQSLTSYHSLKNFSKNVAGTVVTVGGDNFCNFRLGTTRIQDAINSGATDIRIASNTSYSENLSINNQSVTIRGGYTDCSVAAGGIRDTVQSLSAEMLWQIHR